MSAGLRSLLLPLTPLYRFGLALRERRLASGREPIRRLRFPVISIGNLSTGGAGKTPLTIALAEALTQRGFTVDVLSRGYGRRSRLATKVDVQGPAQLYGDEPLLIARTANVPVYVAPQRYDAGLLAERHAGGGPPDKVNRAVGRAQTVGRGFIPGNPAEESTGALAPEACSPGNLTDIPPSATTAFAPDGARLHLLDDGFQHRQLHRDIDILLLNQEDWHDRLLPAGNLREALHAATRAHVIAIPASDPALESDLRARGFRGQIWRLYRRMEIPTISGPVLAFCGIARPQQFFSGLEQAGVDLAGQVAFPDHHHYTARDLQTLAAKARAAGAASLLTTEKDAVRLTGLASPLPIATVPLHTEIESSPAALDWIVERLNLRASPS